jgi:uncharacterized protein YoxC
MTEIFINPLGAEIENSVFYLQNAVKKLEESDTTALSADIATLKEKLNYVLQEVIGIENSVEGLNNYDDTPIKTKIDTALANSQTNGEEIDAIKNKTNCIRKDSNELNLQIASPEDDQVHSLVRMQPNFMQITTNADGNEVGSIQMGGAVDNGYLEISSSKRVSIYSLLKYSCHIELNENGLFLCEMKFEKTLDGIKFTDTLNANHHVTIPWD